MAYWDFLQMTPENMGQARNTSWGSALGQDFNPRNPNYQGFQANPRNVATGSRVGLGSYINQGLRSLVGKFKGGSNIGGATPLMRKMAMSPVARGIGTVGRVAGLANPMGAAAMAAYATPKAINALTARDADATETSLFGLNIKDLEDKAAAYDAGDTNMPRATLDDWAAEGMGPVPVGGDEIQEQVTETAPIRTDFGRIDPLTTNQKPGFFEGIGQKLGMTQVSPEDRLANEQFMQEQGIGVDPQTGRMTSGDFAGKNVAGKSGWGSANFGEMSENWMDKYGDVEYSVGIMGDMKRRKQARMKQRAAEYQAKIQQQAAAEAQRQDALRSAGAYSSQVQMDPGGGGTWHGQTAAKEAAGEQVAGPGFGKGSYFYQGGRVGYNKGGRVGILSIF